MNTKEKAQYLASFYDKLAENNNGFIHPDSNFANGPCIGLTTQELLKYGVNPPKPKKKIIDLSMIVGSDIDCEFGYKNGFSGWGAKLRGVNVDTYICDSNGVVYTSCRIRQEHPIVNMWTECPLPDGLEITIYYVKGEPLRKVTNYNSIDWYKVNYFIVTDTANNARYEWASTDE